MVFTCFGGRPKPPQRDPGGAPLCTWGVEEVAWWGKAQRLSKDARKLLAENNITGDKLRYLDATALRKLSTASREHLLACRATLIAQDEAHRLSQERREEQRVWHDTIRNSELNPVQRMQRDQQNRRIVENARNSRVDFEVLPPDQQATFIEKGRILLLLSEPDSAHAEAAQAIALEKQRLLEALKGHKEGGGAQPPPLPERAAKAPQLAVLRGAKKPVGGRPPPSGSTATSTPTTTTSGSAAKASCSDPPLAPPASPPQDTPPKVQQAPPSNPAPPPDDSTTLSSPSVDSNHFIPPFPITAAAASPGAASGAAEGKGMGSPSPHLTAKSPSPSPDRPRVLPNKRPQPLELQVASPPATNHQALWKSERPPTSPESAKGRSRSGSPTSPKGPFAPVSSEPPERARAPPPLTKSLQDTARMRRSTNTAGSSGVTSSTSSSTTSSSTSSSLPPQQPRSPRSPRSPLRFRSQTPTSLNSATPWQAARLAAQARARAQRRSTLQPEQSPSVPAAVRGAIVFKGVDFSPFPSLPLAKQQLFRAAVREDVCRNLITCDVLPDDVTAIDVHTVGNKITFEVNAEGHKEWIVASELRRLLRNGLFNVDSIKRAYTLYMGLDDSHLTVDDMATRDLRKVRQQRAGLRGDVIPYATDHSPVHDTLPSPRRISPPRRPSPSPQTGTITPPPPPPPTPPPTQPPLSPPPTSGRMSPKPHHIPPSPRKSPQPPAQTTLSMPSHTHERTHAVLRELQAAEARHSSQRRDRREPTPVPRGQTTSLLHSFPDHAPPINSRGPPPPPGVPFPYPLTTPRSAPPLPTAHGPRSPPIFAPVDDTSLELSALSPAPARDSRLYNARDTPTPTRPRNPVNDTLAHTPEMVRCPPLDGSGSSPAPDYPLSPGIKNPILGTFPTARSFSHLDPAPSASILGPSQLEQLQQTDNIMDYLSRPSPQPPQQPHRQQQYAYEWERLQATAHSTQSHIDELKQLVG
eukprot:Sspe_Gene.41883::Locus_20268_Transcript_1_1_Confidence_1.000_Length_3001::g.41883::m.41883